MKFLISAILGAYAAAVKQSSYGYGSYAPSSSSYGYGDDDYGYGDDDYSYGYGKNSYSPSSSYSASTG